MIWSAVALVLLLIARYYVGAPNHQPLIQLPAWVHQADLSHAIIFAIAFCAAVFVDRLIRRYYWHGYLAQRRKREIPALIKDILTVVLVLLGLAVGSLALPDVPVPDIVAGGVAIAGAVAIFLGPSLAPVVQDLISGVTINFDGSYALGDCLTIYSQDPLGTLYGGVVAITWRTTSLMLEDGSKIVIPNRMVTSNPMVNHRRSPHTVPLSVSVAVDIRIPPDRIMDMLLGEAFKAVRLPGLARHPDPTIILDRLSGDAAIYEVRFHAYPDRIQTGPARSLVLLTLQDVMQKSGLPTPATQVEVNQPPNLAFDLGEREIVDALARVHLFRDALTEEQAAVLARRCKPTEVSRGKVWIEQGTEASSMFVILEGAASVWIAGQSGDHREVAVLATGDIVGEASLLTGARRNANVTALTRLRVLEVTKDAMEKLVEKSPEILERFSRVLASRKQELDELAHRGDDMHNTEGALLTRMISFFSRGFRGAGDQT